MVKWCWIMYRYCYRCVADKIKTALGTVSPFTQTQQSRRSVAHCIQEKTERNSSLNSSQLSLVPSLVVGIVPFELNRYKHSFRSDLNHDKRKVVTSLELEFPSDYPVGVTYDCGSVLKKRRSKMNKHKYKKWRKKMKFVRRRLKK